MTAQSTTADPPALQSPHSRDATPSRLPERTLKVLHVMLSLDVGGLERGVVNQVREGQKLGQDVSVLCLERPGTLAPRVEALGARVVSLDKPPGVRPGVFGQMRRALRDLRPDVVHTHQIGTLLYGGRPARQVGIPLVVHTEHGRENYGGRFRTRLLGRLAGRYAQRFFCLSEDMAAHVRGHRIVPADKVRVVLNGIDPSKFRTPGEGPDAPAALRQALGIPVAAPVVGTTGRVNEVKRQDLLVRAFADVRRQLPDAHLVVVGDGPLLGDLKALAAGLGLDRCVHLVGYQQQPQNYYFTFDVFALTSRSEGLPQALLEASVAGVPSIGSRVGGVPEVIDHQRTGLLFDSGDQAALAAGLLRLLSNRQEARRFAEAAREKVESTFTVSRMAADYHRYFVEALAGRGGQ